MSDTLTMVTGRPVWQRGIIAAVIGAIASIVILLVSNAAMSGSVQVPKSMGSKSLVDLNVGQLIGAVVISLVIGTVIALLMHRKGLGARVPMVFGILIVLSLISPLMISGATAGTKLALIVMHLVVGAIAIALLGPARAGSAA